MIIVLCATQNMYPQLQQMITMLIRTQPNLKHIYAFIESDIKSTGIVTCINVRNYPKIIENVVNGDNHWTYMCYVRCYLAEILSKVDKVLYLDLDLHINKPLDDLWDIDISNYAIAGAIDMNARNHFLPYIANLNVYINSGVLLMNLKYFRKHDLTAKLHNLLNSYPLAFPDQDALNIICHGYIKFISNIWNSGGPCGYHDDPIIHHCSAVKPWEPRSIWFKDWVQDYFSSGAVFSTFK